MIQLVHKFRYGRFILSDYPDQTSSLKSSLVKNRKSQLSECGIYEMVDDPELIRSGTKYDKT